MEVYVILIIYSIFSTIFGVVVGYLIARIKFNQEIKDVIKKERKNAVYFSRAVIKGKITEQMYPLLPHFSSKYNLSDARFIGDPIDYIVFNGYTSSKDGNSENPIEIIFVEVKTGNSKLSKTESLIMEAIQDKRVKFEVVTLNA